MTPSEPTVAAYADPAAFIETPPHFGVIELSAGDVMLRSAGPAVAFARYGNRAHRVRTRAVRVQGDRGMRRDRGRCLNEKSIPTSPRCARMKAE
jgi:hypothetical protein